MSDLGRVRQAIWDELNRQQDDGYGYPYISRWERRDDGSEGLIDGNVDMTSVAEAVLRELARRTA